MSVSPLTAHHSPRLAVLPPLSLYIHIPWCVRKCPYCDFNSHEVRQVIPEEAYVAGLTADLESALPAIWGRRVGTVFFGGGTPSIFSAQAIAHVLSTVRARVQLLPGAEITLEANPGTFESERFGAFRAAGVNRLSIGIQSFSPRHLKTLGRIHDDTEARAAIEIGQRNFENFNLDLMYALPGQTVDDVRADIAAALSFAPPHISAYHLTIEPNTYFHRYPPQLPDDDSAAQMQDVVEAMLDAAGYEHYETSAFAKRLNEEPQSGSRLTTHASRLNRLCALCAHNLNYWTFGDYLGIGAGAHSKISCPERIVRQARYRQPAQYMERARAGNAVQEEHTISPTEIPFEFMMNALRLNNGFPVALYQERTGLPLTSVLKQLEEAEERGFITRDHEHIAPTAIGRRFLNDLLLIFMPEQPSGKCVKR